MERRVMAAALALTFLPVAAARAGEAPRREKPSELSEALAAMQAVIDAVARADVREADLADAPARLREMVRTGRFELRDVALLTRWVLQAKEETVARGIGDALRSADLSVGGRQDERWQPALGAMVALFDSALRDAAAHRRRDTKDWPELTALFSAAVPAVAASLHEALPALVAAPESCPLTPPADPTFAPAPPQPGQAPFGGTWYGSPELWTVVRPGGTLGRRNKLFWWSDRWDWRHDSRPGLIVSARRLDGEAPEVRGSRATNAHAEDIGHSMLIGLEIPTPGCWEVTGEYKGATLAFVAWVQ